jgi:hypothetical protein
MINTRIGAELTATRRWYVTMDLDGHVFLGRRSTDMPALVRRIVRLCWDDEKMGSLEKLLGDSEPDHDPANS